MQKPPQEPSGSASPPRYATGEWNNMARRAEHVRCHAAKFARRWPARRVLATAATALTLTFVIGACASNPSEPSPSPTPTASLAHLAITPGGGNRSAKPQKGIVVKVSDGTIVSVRVETDGDRVNGDVNAAATTWRSRWALNTATRYTVRATARDAAGRTAMATSTFRTLRPRHIFRTQIFQGSGLSYGVGMPVILKFSKPITHRRAVERSLRLWSSKRVVGAWYWDGSSTLYFRTRHYWPAHTKVRFVGHLDGIEGAPGVYGTHTLRQSFVIGRSLIAVASTNAHHVRIYLDRHLFATWPISTGKPGDDTPNGTYLTIEKQNPAHMKGPGYDLQVPWSVRFTWSGDYVHDAYWSVGQQGFANVSHGCVNLSPEHAKTYYQLAVPGDPVTISGSPRGRRLGQRLDRVVPVLARAPARQRPAQGGAGRPRGQHVRRSGITLTVESQAAAQRARAGERHCRLGRGVAAQVQLHPGPMEELVKDRRTRSDRTVVSTKETGPYWVRVQEAADLLGVSANTVRRWAADGRIACRRTPSGQRRFLVEDLERALRKVVTPSRGPLAAGRHSEQRYQLLYETSLDLASSLELAEVLQSAARRLSTALQIPDCDIYRLDGDERLVCLASTVGGVYDASWVGQELPLADWPCDRLAVESRQPVTVGSLDDPRLSDGGTRRACCATASAAASRCRS